MLTEPEPLSTDIRRTLPGVAAHLEALDEAAAVIDEADELALACHVHPDGDALGSMLAMKHLCDAHGTRAVCSWPDPFVVGPHYDFLEAAAYAVPPSEVPARPEVMLTFDLGRFSRLGNLEPTARNAATLIVLDHHPDNERFGDINLVDLGAAATAVVVRDLARALGWKLNRDSAMCLYAGLVTDTGRFRYPNTTSEVFHLAEELASFDLPIARIEWELFEKHRFAYLRLVGHVLERARLDPELGLATTWCTTGDLARFGVAFDETEGLIDVVRQAAEAEVSCVAREAAGEGTRVSLRSTGAIDVGEIARRFGGGGHWFMAGFQSDDPIDQILAEVERAVREAPPVHTADA
ncbi:MAG: bifunctional oligoribonuclease/PAP phosphatase NrnA [Actinobacteria bacterium]|nr:bifunctional oligoribonuclease/PAP phosphatase NrnA [Actinomycetota bacterium]